MAHFSFYFMLDLFRFYGVISSVFHTHTHTHTCTHTLIMCVIFHNLFEGFFILIIAVCCYLKGRILQFYSFKSPHKHLHKAQFFLLLFLLLYANVVYISFFFILVYVICLCRLLGRWWRYRLCAVMSLLGHHI